MDILGGGSCSVANLPNRTREVGPDEGRDWKVSSLNFYLLFSMKVSLSVRRASSYLWVRTSWELRKIIYILQLEMEKTFVQFLGTLQKIFRKIVERSFCADTVLFESNKLARILSSKMEWTDVKSVWRKWRNNKFTHRWNYIYSIIQIMSQIRIIYSPGKLRNGLGMRNNLRLFSEDQGKDKNVSIWRINLKIIGHKI